jgi:hypothetical protein
MVVLLVEVDRSRCISSCVRSSDVARRSAACIWPLLLVTRVIMVVVVVVVLAVVEVVVVVVVEVVVVVVVVDVVVVVVTAVTRNAGVTLCQAMISSDSCIDVQLQTKVLDMVRSRFVNSAAKAAAAAAAAAAVSTTFVSAVAEWLSRDLSTGTCRWASGRPR